MRKNLQFISNLKRSKALTITLPCNFRISSLDDMILLIKLGWASYFVRLIINDLFPSLSKSNLHRSIESVPSSSRAKTVKRIQKKQSTMIWLVCTCHTVRITWCSTVVGIASLLCQLQSVYCNAASNDITSTSVFTTMHFWCR